MTQADSIPARIGPYRVLRALGTDRGASKYLCFEEGGSVSDVDVYVASPSDDADARERKASTYVALSHAAIIRLHRFFRDEGRCVAVMEHVSGISLDDLVRARPSGKPLGDQACLLVAERICEALAHAHAQALAHGGLRAVDVMLGPGGTVKLGGFGLVWLLEGSSTAADPRGDVVACGRLLYGLFAALTDEPRELLPLGFVRTGLSGKLTEAIDKAADPSVPVPPQCEELAAIARELLDADAARQELEEAVRAVVSSRARSTARAGTLLGLSPSPFAHSAHAVPISEMTTAPKLALDELPTLPKGHPVAEVRDEVAPVPAPFEVAPVPVPAPVDVAPAPKPFEVTPAPAPERFEVAPAPVAPATDDEEPAIPLRRTSKAGRIVVGLVVVGGLAAGAFYARRHWRARTAVHPAPPTAPSDFAVAPPAASSAAPEPLPIVASAAPSSSAPTAPSPPPNAGYLTVHTTATSASVYIGPTKLGRVETPLTAPCGKRFVAVGLATRKEREPVWLAPGKMIDIPCGGSIEISVQPRRLK